MDKQAPVIGKKFSLVTAFIILDALAALPMLSFMFFGTLAGVAQLGSWLFGGLPLVFASKTLQFTLVCIVFILPSISLIAGVWYGLKYEFVDKRRALIWAAMPWPITAICVEVLALWVG